MKAEQTMEVDATGLTEKQKKRNRFMYGPGTFGRDMVYTLVSTYLMFYLTEVVNIASWQVVAITAVMVVCRVFDALNDPFMGTIVDNTKSIWGKFKPWMAFGMFSSCGLTILIFTDFGLQGAAYVAMFAVLYLLWGVCFTTNDISYWSMMPALSEDQKEREKIGSIARICASVGMFAVVVGITPITNALGAALGDMKSGYTVFAMMVVFIMLAFQCFTIFGVKEPKILIPHQRTTLKEMFKAIGKNDQLLWTAISMVLFMMGYCTTTSFGQYYFKYVYGDENMYTYFAIVLGVSQLAALVAFPFLTKKFTRRQLFLGAMILIFAGYIVFFFSPANMIPIGIGGVMIFLGQACMQMLMLMFLTDCVEYGEWKLHKRNESVNFSLQSLINKMGGAIGSGILGMTIVIVGITDTTEVGSLSESNLWTLKVFMMIIPLIFIIIAFVLYMVKFKLNEKRYAEILDELKVRRVTDAVANGRMTQEEADVALEKIESERKEAALAKENEARAKAAKKAAKLNKSAKNDTADDSSQVDNNADDTADDGLIENAESDTTASEAKDADSINDETKSEE